MKIVDWFKSLLAKLGKKDYMLNAQNSRVIEDKKNTDFVQKVDIDNVEVPKTRADILRGLREEVMVADLSEEYTHGKFSETGIKRYDEDGLLSSEDITALSCLYGAIKEGNRTESEFSNNKINTFLKEDTNNIVVLVNLMLKDARTSYEEMMSNPKFSIKPTSVQGLIAGSYMDVSSIIEEYEKESELAIGE